MKFTYNPAPNYRCKLSTQRIMFELLLGLLVVFAFSLAFYGMEYGSAYVIQAVLIMLVSIVASTVTETLYALAMKKDIKDHMTTSFPFITPVILALMMPINVSLYAVAVSAVLCTFFGKLVFGGFGQNIFNPAALGRAIIFAAFTGLTAKEIVISGATPTTLIASSYNWCVTDASMVEQLLTSVGGLGTLLIGWHPGALGETSALLIMIVGVVLAYRQVIDWRVPVVYVGSVFVLTLIMGLVKGMGLWYPVYHVLTGGLMFGAVFMATDPVTNPTSAAGRSIFALGCGILTVLIRVKANLPEGVLYSILIMNCLTPMIEKFMDCEQVSGAKKALKAFVGVAVVGLAACLLAFSQVEPAKAAPVVGEDGKTKLNAAAVEGIETKVISIDGNVTTVSAYGFGGMNTFEVTLDGDKIASIKMTEFKDTPGIGDLIDTDEFYSQFAGQGSNLEVDAVSGATFTSKSAVAAAQAALSGEAPVEGGDEAGEDTSNKLTAENSTVAGYNAEIVSVEETDAGTVKEVKVDGFAGQNTIRVTVKEGAVVSVECVEINDTAGIGTQVENEDFLAQFAGQSEVAVDAVAGATFSSASVTKAVVAALAE